MYSNNNLIFQLNLKINLILILNQILILILISSAIFTLKFVY